MADERRTEGFVWASTGRRLASARVGRRWHEIRGPLLAAAAFALTQAIIVYLALRALQETGSRLLWLVPIVTLSTLALVAWMGLVRAAFGRVVPLGQAPAAKILEMVDAFRPALRAGLDRTSAQVLAFEAHERLGYGAVAVTDRDQVLAHVGLGADHHGAGLPAPPGAVDAMVEHRVTRLPVGWKHGCDGRDCPLKSAVVAPLEVRGQSIGSLVLFSEGALAVSDRDRAIARQLGSLVSTELQVGELDLHVRATASAELAAVQAQIEPHFLFNALNTIAAFCRTQPDEARRLVLSFAELLPLVAAPPGGVRRARARSCATSRPTSRSSERASATSSRSRCASRPARARRWCRRSWCSRLVENAIKHGKADRPLRVVVRAEVRLGRLRVTVRDNGRGIPREIADRVTEPGVGDGAAGLGLASARSASPPSTATSGGCGSRRRPRIGTLVSIVLPTAPPVREHRRPRRARRLG